MRHNKGMTRVSDLARTWGPSLLLVGVLLLMTALSPLLGVAATVATAALVWAKAARDAARKPVRVRSEDRRPRR